MWYWNPAFAVFLRTARSHPRVAQSILNSARTCGYAKPKAPPPQVPKDEGDHDPDIDLITLRRRSASTQKQSQTESSKPLPFRIPIVDASEEPHKHKRGAVPPKLPPRPKVEPIQQDTKPTPPKAPIPIEEHARTAEEPPVSPSSTSGVAPKPSASPDHHQAENPRAEPPPSVTIETLLERFLKPQTPPKVFPELPKRAPQEPLPKAFLPEDADMDLLRPHDIRVKYLRASLARNGKNKSNNHHPNNNSQISNVPLRSSGVVGDVPEHEADSRIRRLGLRAEDSRVIIPRPILSRLIEDTITLSGASIQGDDVIIQRYSPTWHRFARLLRTSDLHKISSSRSSGPPPMPRESRETGTTNAEISTVAEIEQLPKEMKAEPQEKEAKREAEASELSNPSPEQTVAQTSQPANPKIEKDREYIFLIPEEAKGEQPAKEVKPEPLPKESKTEAEAREPTSPSSEQTFIQTTNPSTPVIEKDREYIVLSLNSRKRKVISSKFRKLLDPVSDSGLKSSEGLLKVEYLDRFNLIQRNLTSRYIPHLKSLESEGFYIIAATESGIILCKDSIRDPNGENASGGGWSFGRLWKASKSHRKDSM